jgi:predicted O-methyltransferase YrrM
VGRRLIATAISDEAVVRDVVNELSDRIAADASFEGLSHRIESFEDCTALLSSNQVNHGVSRLMIAEAAHLYRLVRSLDAPAVVEIGRYRGGTTFLLAAAGGRVLSIDVDPEVGTHDRRLLRVLEDRGLADRVTLVIADSRQHEVDPASQDIVFVDGDHTYDGARADVEHWLPAVKPGGHLVLHDAVRPEPPRPWSDPWKVEGVRRVCAELLDDPRLMLAGRAGTLADLVVAAD